MGVNRKPGSGRKPTKKRLKRSVSKRQASRRRAIATLESYVNDDGTRKQTSIEARFEKMLLSMGLYFDREYRVTLDGKTRFYDFRVTNGVWAFLAEIDGEYWHAQKYKDGKTPYSKLSRLQRRNLRNDKLKDCFAKRLGVPLLRFTEDEVKRNISGAAAKVAAEIAAQGGEPPDCAILEGLKEPPLSAFSDENDEKRAQ